MNRLAAAALLTFTAARLFAEDATTISVAGAHGKTLALTTTDLRKLEPRTIQATDPHSKETAAYLVVPLAKILTLVDTPFGEALKGPALAATVRAEARDGYRVAFSLVELDARTAGTEAFVAFEREGKLLPAEMGPFRLLVTTDRRGARWVRQLARVTLME